MHGSTAFSADSSALLNIKSWKAHGRFLQVMPCVLTECTDSKRIWMGAEEARVHVRDLRGAIQSTCKSPCCAACLTALMLRRMLLPAGEAEAGGLAKRS